MNKAYCKIKFFLITLLTVCLITFNAGCGLDTVYVIDAPGTIIHEPVYTSIFPEDKYFEFITNERKYEGINFLGTEIYYKIYRNSSVMENERKIINSAALSDSSSSRSADLLISNYKYYSLEADGYYSSDVLIPFENDNRRVLIRLDDISPYEAGIFINGENIYGASSRVLPVRNVPERVSFNFTKDDPKTIPKSDDVDVKYNGNGTDTEWYVCMFAVGVAQDANYVPVYSNALYLGSVKIDVN